MDVAVNVGIRIDARAQELVTSNPGMSMEYARQSAIIEELQRINTILRKQNLQ